MLATCGVTNGPMCVGVTIVANSYPYMCAGVM